MRGRPPAWVACLALGCSVPNVVFDDSDAGSSGTASSDSGSSGASSASGSASGCSAGGLPSAVCCKSIPSPIPCVGAACSTSLCTPGQCDQCVGQVCCAKTTGMSVGITCRTDPTKCPP
jgi:hypothetical protein